MVRITTLEQQTFSQSDPVLIRQFSKKLQSDPAKIGISPGPRHYASQSTK